MAENQYGVSEPLATQEAIKAKLPYDPPGPCDQLVVEDISATSVILSWRPPCDNGGASVQGYIVEKRGSGKPNWTKDNVKLVKDTDYVSKNLPEGTEFEFRVVAVNKAGPGKPSKSTNSLKVQTPMKAPRIDACQLKEVAAISEEQFSIFFTFKGYPKPEVKLSKDGQPVDASRYHVNFCGA